MVTPPVFDIFNGRFDILNRHLPGANFRTATFWLVGVVVTLQILLTRTSFGNHVFAVGGNEDAALAQGVRAKLVKLVCFTLTGVTSGLAGIISFSQFHTVRVAEQAGVELTAIAAAVVGGTLLTGGRGSIWGGLVGILMIQVLRSGVILLKIPFIPADNFPAVIGLTIIGAVILNRYLHGRPV
jgi:ribose/xylose/arabinose/galactoside ABC-type transport system permease subunit